MNKSDLVLPPNIDTEGVLALQRAISRTSGFGVFIVRLNDMRLRVQVSNELVKKITRPIRSIQLSTNDNLLMLLQTANSKASSNEIFSIINIEDVDEENTLRSLNWERAAFQKINHPMVFWLSEYWVQALMSGAPDFYDLHSGFYELDLVSSPDFYRVSTNQANSTDSMPERLGAISLSILESIVADELKEKPITSNRYVSRTTDISEVLQRSERRFSVEYENNRMVNFLLRDASLEIDHEDLTRGLNDILNRANFSLLSRVLVTSLIKQFPKYRQEIKPAIDFYLRLLSEELAVSNLASAQYFGGYDESSEPSVVAFSPLHQLPEPPVDFTGREDLVAQLVTDLKKGNGAVITGQSIQGITGMGGIGKTALGLVVAHKIAKDYPDAQIFLDLKGTTTPLSSMDVMRHVILSFEPTLDLRKLDETNLSNAYRMVLLGKRALLFFDNARSAEQIALLRPPVKCAMLVTSRWNFSVPDFINRRVDVMDPRDAEEFLLELCPRIDDKAAELAGTCGYLPLALRLAGNFLNVNNSWSVEKYIAELKERKNYLAASQKRREERESKTELDLLPTFELSYNSLSDENQRYLRNAGVFPTSFDQSAVSTIWELQEGEAGNVLRLLIRYGLLDYDKASSRYDLPDMLADYALSRTDTEEKVQARTKHALHYLQVLREINDLYFKGREQTLVASRQFDLEWENIRMGQEWAATRNLFYLCVEYAYAGAYVLSLRQHPRERIEWLEAAISAAHNMGDKKSEGNILGNLGNAYADLGNTREAIEFYKQALVIDREIENRRGEAADLDNLGAAYAALGDVRKAIEFFEQALVIDREIGDRRGEGTDLGNLGISYFHLGDVRKAIEFLERALVIDREIGDRRGEVTALSNLGNTYSALGDVNRSIEFYEKALLINREIGDRRNEGVTLGNLGIAYKDLGDVRKAIEFHEQALLIDREIGDRRGEAADLGNLGIAYKDLGNARRAIEFYEEALTINREIGDRRGEGNTLFNMGRALYSLEEKDRAIELVKQALGIYKQIESPAAEQTRHQLREWGVS